MTNGKGHAADGRVVIDEETESEFDDVTIDSLNEGCAKGNSSEGKIDSNSDEDPFAGIPF